MKGGSSKPNPGESSSEPFVPAFRLRAEDIDMTSRGNGVWENFVGPWDNGLITKVVSCVETPDRSEGRCAGFFFRGTWTLPVGDSSRFLEAASPIDSRFRFRSSLEETGPVSVEVPCFGGSKIPLMRPLVNSSTFHS